MNHKWLKACDAISQRIRQRSRSARSGETQLPYMHMVLKVRRLLVLICLSSLSACQGQGQPKTADEKIVFSTLKLLASDGKFVCVDNATSGPPLAVFGTTMRNRPAGLEPPTWFAPAALRPPAALSSSELLRGAQTNTNVHIDQPTNSTSALAPALQGELNRAAGQLSTQNGDQKISHIDAWDIRGVLPRWWLRNRLSWHCAPNYRLSNPVSAQNVGFITVIADHWATTYAFNRHDSDWVAVAQWSNWIY